MSVIFEHPLLTLLFIGWIGLWVNVSIKMAIDK